MPPSQNPVPVGLAGLAQQGAGRALQQMNLGLGSMGRGIGLGSQLYGQQYGMGSDLRNIQNQLYGQQLYQMQQGLGMIQNAGPYGQTTTSEGPGGSPLAGAAGGALAGSAFGPIGAGIGGGLGLLGWL